MNMSDERDAEVLCMKKEIIEVEEEEELLLFDSPGEAASPVAPCPQQDALQMVRVKTEPSTEQDNNGGTYASAFSPRPERVGAGSSYSKKRKRDKIRTEGMNIKKEPLDPDEPLPTGRAMQGGQSNAELGAIQQLLSTLQKPVDDDQVFGDHVACELRSMRCTVVKKRLKKTIMMAIINALEEDNY